MTDALEELRSRLHEAVKELRAGDAQPDETLEMIEECARLATAAASETQNSVRASLEPLPDLPGQLPLSAA